MVKMTLQDDLSTAAATGNVSAVEDLLLNGADVNGVNRQGYTALQVMMMGSTAVAQLLLERGANPNVTDRHTGATPLHDAARTGFVDTVQVLLQYHADPTVRDKWHCLAVDLATESGHKDVVATFLEC